MPHPRRLMLASAALALACTSVAFAQSSPMPMASPATNVMTMPPMSPGATGGASMMPAPTTAPSTTAPSTAAPSTAAPAATTAPTRGTGSPRSMNTGGGKVKTIKSGTLTRSQAVYGLTHQVQAAKQLLKMKTINFDNLRVYKLPTTLKSVLKVGDADTQAIALAMLGNGIQVAQTTPNLPATNGNNSPIQYLRDVLANINVSNALNNLNVLNNSNVNVNVALSNVLNNNKISIGQVVGLYIGGGGIITTITN